VREVDAAAPVIAVDLAGPRPTGVGPMLEPALADAAEDLVEVIVADQEGIVLRGDFTIALVKVERDAVVDLDHEEGTEASGPRPPQHLGEKGRRSPFVAAPDDGVVQLHAHAPILHILGSSTRAVAALASAIRPSS